VYNGRKAKIIRHVPGHQMGWIIDPGLAPLPLSSSSRNNSAFIAECACANSGHIHPRASHSDTAHNYSVV
jgi:hypothetical protein